MRFYIHFLSWMCVGWRFSVKCGVNRETEAFIPKKYCPFDRKMILMISSRDFWLSTSVETKQQQKKKTAKTFDSSEEKKPIVARLFGGTWFEETMRCVCVCVCDRAKYSSTAQASAANKCATLKILNVNEFVMLIFFHENRLAFGSWRNRAF